MSSSVARSIVRGSTTRILNCYCHGIRAAVSRDRSLLVPSLSSVSTSSRPPLVTLSMYFSSSSCAKAKDYKTNTKIVDKNYNNLAIRSFSTQTTSSTTTTNATERTPTTATPVTTSEYDDEHNSNDIDNRKSDDNTNIIVYESPMGDAVKRLRAVSLLTGIIGTVGLPLIVALKGGIGPDTTGLIGIGVAFVTCTVGSTIAVHYVFSPYVYRIEKIPVRKCHSPSPVTITSTKNESTTNIEGCKNDDSMTTVTNASTNDNCINNKKDMLYKAMTRTLFLQNQEIVFDPEIDMTPYRNGWRPLCNFVVKGTVPLYVHSDLLRDPIIKAKLQSFQAPPINEDKNLSKENPDDFL